MELRQLEYFATVAEIENMSAAARQLHVSQPSLSMTISRLEEDLGVPLFDRIGGKIHLSRIGRDLLQNTQNILHQIDEMYAKSAEHTKSAQGEVIFGISEAGLVTAIINSYLDKYPPLTFRQTIATREQLAFQLESGVLDFAIVRDPKPSQAINWFPLITDEVMAIVAPDHPLASAGNGSVSAEELLGYPFVLNEFDLSADGSFHNLFYDYGREPNIQLISQESTVVMETMRRGLGVGLISEVLLRIQQAHSPILKDIVALRITGAHTKSTLGLSTLQGRFMPAAARRFYEFIKDYFSDLDVK